MNDESQSANEKECHTRRQGLGEVGRPFHDVDIYQMLVETSASVQDDFTVNAVLSHFQPIKCRYLINMGFDVIRMYVFHHSVVISFSLQLKKHVLVCTYTLN